MSCARKKRDAAAAETSEDAVLDGRLVLRQKRRGHRVGHDAILLAAATGAAAGEHAVDLGAGIGAAGLALAARVPGLALTLVEIDPALAALAAQNIARNGLGNRARAVVLDATAPAPAFTAAGLPPGSATRVLMNPPFNDQATRNVSPDPDRRLAHVSGPDGIAPWLRSADRLLAPRGNLTLIWRADGLADVLAALAHRFGAVAVLPVHPRPDAPAIRILVRAVKASRAPLALLPALILADAHGRPTPAAEAVLRHGATLALAGM
jgi:tRNA1(Val) A37 N6-methylase TrmN6